MRKPYEVGFKKPPIRTRFRKGRSGNPSGKGRAGPRISNSNEIWANLLSEPMTITVGESSKKVTRMEALYMTIYKRALAGHGPSMKIMMEKIDNIPPEYKDPNVEFFRHNSASERLIEDLRQAAIKYGALGDSRIDDDPSDEHSRGR